MTQENRSTRLSPTGWLVIAILSVLLVAAVVAAIIGWGPTGEGPGISWKGMLALVLGAVGTLVVGGGLMALAFHSAKSGHDEAVHRETSRRMPPDSPADGEPDDPPADITRR